MINKIKVYFTFITTILISIFFYGVKKKNEGKIEERGKIEKANYKQIRKNAELKRRLENLEESELDKLI